MILWDIAPPPPLSGDTTWGVTFIKHVYQLSKLGLVSRGEGGDGADAKTENETIWSWLCYINDRVLWQFFYENW